MQIYDSCDFFVQLYLLCYLAVNPGTRSDGLRPPEKDCIKYCGTGISVKETVIGKDSILGR